MVYERAPGDLSDDDYELLMDDIDVMSSLDISSDMLSEDKLRLLAEICTYCRDNGIELSVITTPHRTDYYERFSTFKDYTAALSLYLDAFVSKRGVAYYDTEDDPMLHEILPDDYFLDWEHVSPEYTDAATDYLTGIIQELDRHNIN